MDIVGAEAVRNADHGRYGCGIAHADITTRRCLNDIDFAKPRIVHVLDTLHLDIIALSETYLDAIANIPEIEVISDPYELSFDDEGFLITNW